MEQENAVKLLIETVGFVGLGTILWRVSSMLSALRSDINGLTAWLDKVETRVHEQVESTGDHHFRVVDELSTLRSMVERMDERSRSTEDRLRRISERVKAVEGR